MRKIKRWKQGIAIAGVIALSGSLLTGCGGTGKKSSNSSEKTENTKAMGRFLENDIAVPENSQFLRDVKVIDSGALRMIYYSTADSCYYASDSTDNGETWTNGKSLEELLGLKEDQG